MNDQGIKYPIWGTCLGFESLLLALSDFTTEINNDLDDLNILLPAKIDKTITSVLNSAYSQYELDYMSTNNVFHYGHRWGFLMDKMKNDDYVKANIDIVATVVTKHSQEVIAAFQHKKYPYFGIQFHPEAAQFAHDDGCVVDTTDLSLGINRKMALAVKKLLEGTKIETSNDDIAFYKQDLQFTFTMYDCHEAFYRLPESQTAEES